MITISKPKLLALLFSLLILLPSFVATSHALYVVTLPSNTIYADDFESYGVNGALDAGSGVGTGNSNGLGWSFYDSDNSGIRNVTTWAFYSPFHSLMLQSGTAANAKFDVHRNVAITNSTTTVSMSVWMAFDNKTRNENNLLTFSLETWDYVNKYECVVDVHPQSATVGLNTASGEQLAPGLRISAVDDTRFTWGRGFWHHIYLSINTRTHKYVAAQIDNWDLMFLVPGATNACDATGDPTFLVAGKPFTIPVRFEFANVNGVSFNNPADIYHKWVDNVIITDDTPARPNIIQFGIVTSSSLFQLILITTAMMYISSGFGSVMRVFAKDKVPKFLGPKFIIITGVVGTAGFLFMLIVGANLVSIACPPGAVCSG
jgi:hypothetical protein